MRFLLFLFPFVLVAQQAVYEDSVDAFAKAEFHYANREFSKAQPIFENHLKAHPDDLKTMEYLGDIAAHAKNWDVALDYYELLIDAKPQQANYHYKYGGVLGLKAFEVSKLRALGMIGDIRRSLEKAAQLDPNHIDTRWALIEYYIQLPGIIGGSERKALKYADELLSISPVDGHLSHGYIAEYSGRTADAESHFLAAVAVGGSVTCYSKLADHYEKSHPEKAVQTLLEAQQKHVTANRLHYQLGKVSAQYKVKLDAGITCLKHYIDNHTNADGVPKDWAYLRLAQIYRHKGDKQRAQKWILKALASRPDFKEALEEQEIIATL